MEPYPGLLHVARANVTSIRLHWHAVSEWRADVVLISETGLTVVAQQLVRARDGASRWQALWGALLESPGGGGIWDMPAGGGGSSCPKTLPRDKSPPKGAPPDEADTLAQTVWHSTCWCQVLVGLGRGVDSLHAQMAYGVSSQQVLRRVFCDHATQPMARHGVSPTSGGTSTLTSTTSCGLPRLSWRPYWSAGWWTGTLNCGPPSLGDSRCLYEGAEGTHPSRIAGLLVDTRLVALLYAVGLVPRGAILGHTPVRFDLPRRESSYRVVKFVRPKPVLLAPREEHEQLLLTQRLLDLLEAKWQAALSMGDVDRAWAFWTTAAAETFLALAPGSFPAVAAVPLAPPHRPRGRGSNQLLCEVCLCPRQRRDTGGPLTSPLARI